MAEYTPTTEEVRNCSVASCGRPHHSKGLCKAHYKRRRRLGTELATVPIMKRYYDSEESFSNRTRRERDCIVWTGSIDGGGYGIMQYDGETGAAHRYAWQRANGWIPEGFVVDHICHNRRCVKLAHLRLATTAQNVAYRSGPDADSASGVRNVRWRSNKWEVAVRKGGKCHYFGRFNSRERAIEVADEARKKLFGEFAGNGEHADGARAVLTALAAMGGER